MSKKSRFGQTLIWGKLTVLCAKSQSGGTARVHALQEAATQPWFSKGAVDEHPATWALRKVPLEEMLLGLG